MLHGILERSKVLNFTYSTHYGSNTGCRDRSQHRNMRKHVLLHSCPSCEGCTKHGTVSSGSVMRCSLMVEERFITASYQRKIRNLITRYYYETQ